MGLSCTIAASPRQRSNSRVRVPRDTWLYFTLSDSRLLQPGGPGPRIYIPQKQGGPFITPGIGFFSSPSTIRRATVEMFNPASPRHCLVTLIYDWTTYIVSRRIHRKQIRCPTMDICEPHRKRLFLYCSIYSASHRIWSYPIVACLFFVAYCCSLYLATGCLTRICLRGNVLTESLTSNGSTYHNIYVPPVPGGIIEPHCSWGI
jgi:hypothetical protein